MNKFIQVAKKTDIPAGKMRECRIGDKTIVVANTEGEYLAFDGLCTHAECPLAGGFLDGYTLTCYCHGAQFDIKTGKVLAPPATVPLNIYKVKTEGEDVFVAI
jgi:3-phenylpropionate/trans-cinnamate dioxygenase ferredoxin subunit